MKKTLWGLVVVSVIVSASAVHADDWPTFMGGPARTGACKDTGIRPPLKLLWRYRTDGSVRGSICVAGGIAYACSRDSNVYALNAKTGRLVWQKRLGSLERATLSVARGKVFVALNAHRNRKIFALDAKTGREVWSRPVPAPNVTRTGPLVVDDAVITFCWVEEENKAGLICLEEADGRVRWRVTGSYRLVGDPSSDGNAVFFATSEGGRGKSSELRAVAVKTGKVLWHRDDILVHGIPTIANYGISVYRGVLYFTGRELAGKWPRLFAIDAKTGKKIWESETLGRGGYSPVPAVTEKFVFPRTAAVDRATGKQIWAFPFKPISCSPAVAANGYVFFGSSTGVRANGLTGRWARPQEGLTAIPRAEGAAKVYVLDAATGKFVGDFQAMNRICSAMAIVDDILYFGSYDGCVYAVVHDEGAKPVAGDVLVEVKTDLQTPVTANKRAEQWYRDRPRAWPMFRHDSQRTGFADERIDSGKLRLLWSRDLGGKVRSSAAIVDGRIYVGSDDRHLYCLDAKSGRVVWKFRTGGWVRSSPAIWNGRVYVGSHDHKFYCLDAATGTVRWTVETGDVVESSPCVFEGVVYFGSFDKCLYALDAMTGARRWVFTSFGYISASPVVTEKEVCFGAWDSRIYCLERRDGKPRWGRVIEDIKGNPQGGCIVSSPAVIGKWLLVTADDPFNGVGAYDLATGRQIWWQRSWVSVKSSPAVVPGRLFYGSERSFWCRSVETGEGLWHRWPLLVFFSSPTVVKGAVFLGGTDGTLYCLSSEENKLLWKFKTKSAIRSSPSVGEGLLVVGSDDGHIYAFGGPPEVKNAEVKEP